MNETLRELLQRRLREMGAQRGSSEPLSTKAAYDRVPELLPSGEKRVTYEVPRRVMAGQRPRISERSVQTLAAMIEVDDNVVWEAANRAPVLEPWKPPADADRLTDDQRTVVESVIAALVAASERRAEVVSEVVELDGQRQIRERR